MSNISKFLTPVPDKLSPNLQVFKTVYTLNRRQPEVEVKLSSLPVQILAEQLTVYFHSLLSSVPLEEFTTMPITSRNAKPALQTLIDACNKVYYLYFLYLRSR